MRELVCDYCDDGPCRVMVKSKVTPRNCIKTRFNFELCSWKPVGEEDSDCHQCGKKTNFVIYVADWNGDAWITKWVCRECALKKERLQRGRK